MDEEKTPLQWKLPVAEVSETAPSKNLVEQALELWITPEIDRRKADGRITGEFALLAAQVIMNVDSSPEVRLNGEVKAALRLKANQPIEPGGEIRLGENIEIEDVNLTDFDPNAGHVTMLLHGNTWLLRFDFRYNARRVEETLRLAREFLDAAKFGLEKNNLNAFVDALFSATELVAKAQLLMMPDPSLLRLTSHGPIHSKYNWWGKLGNAEQRYVQLFNRLSQLRTMARYRGERPVSAEDGKTMLATAEDMYQWVFSEIPTRVKISAETSQLEITRPV